jgi:hypothetical protein
VSAGLTGVAGFARVRAGQIFDMTTVTADDIRVLAQSDDEDPVLVVVDGDVQVMGAREVSADRPGQVIYSQAELLADSGVEVTDLEAETIAAGLTARLT